ncbi:MAG: cation:proton antiporter [bacterium]|nr:cation:proton antiporter [bacterium]
MDATSSLFLQFGLVLGLGTILGYGAYLLKLPLIVAYLAVGVLAAFFGNVDLANSEAFTVFSQIGIAFVLFFIGMEMDIGEIRNLGKPILFGSLCQIIISFAAGFLIASFLGFEQTEAVILGVGLSFSSTIVVVKLLLEKKDINSLYGKLSVGILLVEDLVAIILLMGMSVTSSSFNLGIQNSLPFFALFFKALLLLFTALGLSRFVLKRIFQAVAASTELLFLTALAWCFVFISITIILGFSVTIGAFLAGLALASSPFYYEIQGKVKPLRDFFVMTFFVYLGSQVKFNEVEGVLPLIVAFTVYALIAKPTIYLAVLGMFGFRKHTLYQTALNLSQVSEFSLIIALVALHSGLISSSVVTALALSTVVSIILSSVMISCSRKFYSKLGRLIEFFVHKNNVHAFETKEGVEALAGHVVVIGAHRMGGEVIRYLRRHSIPFVALDFNPRVVKNLMNEKIPAFYGDVGDPEVLEFLNLEDAALIVSTAPDVEDNLILLSEKRRRKLGAYTVTRAGTINEAKQLYDQGADYVVLPELVSGEKVTAILKDHWPTLDFFKGRPEKELNKLFRNRFALG